MADNETKIETDIEINVKKNELSKLQKDFEKFSEAVEKSNEKIKELEKELESLSKRRPSMTQTAYTSELNNITKNLSSAKQDRKENNELKRITQKEINDINEYIKSTEENTEETKKNTNAKKKSTKAEEKKAKAEEDSAKAEEKKAKEAEKSARLERDSQSKKTNSEARLLKAQAEMTVALAKENYYNKRTESVQRRRTLKYQAGRGLISSGIYLGGSISKPIGNMLSTGFEAAGAALANPAAIASVAIQQLVKGVTQLGKASIQAYGEIDSLKTQLGVIYGNQTQADTAFGQLSSYATKSPFGVQQTTEIATLLKQSGVEQSYLMDTIKMLGDTAGGNMEKMKRIANNYAQIISIGKASMLDMRQFAYAGIPIFEKVAEELNVSQTALRGMISDGKVTADVIETVFKKMTDAGGLFYEATSKGSETLKARLQNLKDVKQLYLSSFGEKILRIGEKTGKDSLGFKAIDFAEDFYTKLNEKTSLHNLEKSVESIKNVVNEKNNLEELLQYAKDTGQSKEVIKSLEDKISSLDKKRNPDKERSLLSNLYEAYRGNESTKLYEVQDKKYREAYIRLETEGYYTKMLEAASSNYVYKISRLNSILKVYEGKPEFEETYNDLINERKKLTERYNEEILDLQKRKEIDDLVYEAEEDRVKALKELTEAQSKITDEMRLAYKETQIMTTQQTYFDYTNKSGNSSLSAKNDLSQMQEFYQNTEEYKKKEQEDLISRLTSTEKLLSEISKNTKEGTDILDFKSVAGKKLSDYIARGAVQGRKLATTLDSEGSITDWKYLQKNIVTAASVIRNLSSTKKVEGGDTVAGLLTTTGLVKASNAEAFYNSFTNSYRAAFEKAFDSAAKADNDTARDFWNEILEILKQTLLDYSSIGLAPENWIKGIDKQGKSTEDSFIPLWKRILSQYTGIPSTAISGTRDAIDFYGENLSTRSMTGNTLSALVKEGLSINTLSALTGNMTGVLTPNGTNTPVGQIDWVKTRQGMTEFVSALSTSTTAIDTWTSGLEQERNVYAELIGAGILSAESNNTGKAMYISAKKLDQKWLSADDFGINAFGTLTNEKGELVTAIKDGIAYGKKDGKEYVLENQNLKITENIYNVIKEKLEEINKELKEANKVRTYNNILSGMQNNILGANVINAAAIGQGAGVTGFLNSNTEDYLKLLEQNIDFTGFNNISEFYSSYLSGNEESIREFNKAISITNKEVLQFINSDLYSTLKDFNDNLEETKNINNAYNTFLGSFNKSSPEKTGYEAELMSKFGMGGVSVKELSDYANKRTNSNSFELSQLEKYGSGDSQRANELREELKLTEELTEQKIKEALAQKELDETVKDMGKNVAAIAKQTAKDTFLSPFNTLGKDFIDLTTNAKSWNDYLGDAKNSLKDIAGNMLSNMGNEMATAGFRIAAAAALEKNWGVVAAGLGLAAVGGFSSGLGSALNNASQDKDKSDKEIEKLENLKNQLQTLLEQARTDALYYEQNLRHKTALGINDKYSYKSVNDAIITPTGVVNTHPDDYIIATKTPQSFMGGSSNIKINNIINNNAGVTVTQEERTNSDGSIDLITTIDSAIGNYIASSKGDEAFNAREARLRGKVAVM